MGERTAISWADHTFNPWIGCTKISPACDGCYAAHLMDTRLHRVEWGGERKRTSESNWREPLKWQRAAAAAGTRPFVFCSSLADVFDNQVPAEWRADLFDLIEATPHLVWLLLTKRPQNIVKMVKAIGKMPKNIAFGTTVEDLQRRRNLADLAVASLLRPLFTFMSAEPLLEDLGDLSPWLCPPGWPLNSPENEELARLTPMPLGWVITGGETDQGAHKARSTPAGAFVSLRDQTIAAGRVFHHKQNGEFLGGVRVGKHSSGRKLDGVVYDGRPVIGEVQ